MPRLHHLLIGVVSGCLALAAPAAAQDSDPLRIQMIGGQLSPGDTYPFAVVLQGRMDSAGWGTSKEYRSFCSGSLIAPQWILTAAHCATLTAMPSRPSGLLRVWFADAYTAGSPQVGVDRVIVHPYYVSDMRIPARAEAANVWPPTVSSVDRGQDVALLHLSEAVSGIDPVALATTRQADSSNRAAAIAGGYGAYNETTYAMSNDLRSGSVPLASDSSCSRQRLEGVPYSLVNPSWTLCSRQDASLAPGEGLVCFGDSGGPLVLPGTPPTLVGVVSSGYVPGNVCQGTPVLSLFSRVSSLTDWISRQSATNLTGRPSFNLAVRTPTLRLTGARLVARGALRISVRSSDARPPTTVRALAVRQLPVRSWYGGKWKPLAGWDLRFRYAGIRPRRAATLTLPTLGGSWRKGQCVLLLLQAMGREHDPTRLSQAPLLIVKRGRSLTVRRSSCGYRMS